MPMWLLDLETLRFLAVNDAAIIHYGYPRDIFMQITVSDLRFSEDRADFQKFLYQGETSEGLKVWRQRGAIKPAIAAFR